MSRWYKSGLPVAAFCFAGMVSPAADAGDCLGPQIPAVPNSRPQASECTDPETGAGILVGIGNFSNNVPTGLVVKLTAIGRARSYRLTGYTFDIDGQVIDDCTAIVESPDELYNEYELDACRDAVTLIAYGHFVP